MGHSIDPRTGFPELDALLARFVDRVQSILGDHLIGVYLTGSFAIGGGDASSDCDFLVATREKVDRNQERNLRILHRGILDWPGYWAYNFEGSYATVEDLRTITTIGQPWLYVNRGMREMEWSPHCNAEDVRWVLRERSPTLVGTPPSAFACEVPTELLRCKMRQQIEGFLDDLRTWASFDISWTQRYAVEAISRMLYTLERGEVIPKQAALNWAEETMPGEWHNLIRQVRDDRFVTWNAPPMPRSVERSLAYVEYVKHRACTTPELK